MRFHIIFALLVSVLLSSLCVAQPTPEDLKRFKEYPDLVKDKVLNESVKINWLDAKGSNFWYEEFVLSDDDRDVKPLETNERVE